ncbi:MAG: DUF475 domain-containing protein [bacterium]|nr:DUF475 domain-containing protein [Candidatus Wildermuthbacteria bacterium]MDP2664812.1 DUF475 domain-containing protein [bacterium]
MNMLTLVLVVIGLIIFEVVNSVDNAIVNAHMLKTMSPKARRWFLLWGILTAVVLVRGLLPLAIVWLTTPSLSIFEVFAATFGANPVAKGAIDASAHILLIGGGMFMLLLYLHWLFLEKKDPFFFSDKLVRPNYGVWFFAGAALLLVTFLWIARDDPFMMLGAAIGNAVFFILYGFRETAERQEHVVEHQTTSDLSKLMFLEVLDTSFSIDGVIGAFAFTTSVLLIFIGNGIGALVVREITIRSIEKIAKYRWIKNGAMTSIGFLGIFMILKSFGVHVPEWLPTLVTISMVGITFWASHQYLKKNGTGNTVAA